jgi:chorismate mutase / prephenate dehydratase
MSDSTEKVSNPRAEIDAIDDELLRLLNKRAEIALRVGAAKTRDDASLCDHNREREVLTRLCRENPGPFDEQSIYSIFQRIIDESLHLQQATYHEPLDVSGNTNASIREIAAHSRVAFFGEPGTFSEEATLGLLGGSGHTVSCPTFDDLFRAIEEDRADFILTPLENTLVGSIHRCYDLLLDSSLHIVAEVLLPISHYLISNANATIDTIESVESHPAALGQCETFFSAHPNLRRIPANDTAGSVRRVVESGDPTRAAIGSRRAAESYGGKILREHIEDHAENFTRFALLSRDSFVSADGGKVSLVLRLRHQPGALHSALRPFVRRGINLIKIESRPIKGHPSQFNFYFDLQAPAKENELNAALDEIREQADEVRFLGRYPTIELTSQP